MRFSILYILWPFVFVFCFVFGKLLHVCCLFYFLGFRLFMLNFS